MSFQPTYSMVVFKSHPLDAAQDAKPRRSEWLENNAASCKPASVSIFRKSVMKLVGCMDEVPIAPQRLIAGNSGPWVSPEICIQTSQARTGQRHFSAGAL